MIPGSIENPQPNVHRGTDSGQSIVWGLWEVRIDEGADAITAEPMRGADFACNVVKFLNSVPGSLKFNNLKKDIQADCVYIDVDIGLVHPFPGLDIYTGFDVIGVYLGDVSGTYPGDEPLAVGQDGDFQMLNPDGYTRWFNAPEFAGAGAIKPIFGYVPGVLGPTGFVPDGTLNPYKYFADGLDPDADEMVYLMANPELRGCYKPGSVNWRHYRLKRPLAAPAVFQYAVVAHWEPNKNHPGPPESLDDFPPSANSDEALVVSVVDQSDLTYFPDGTWSGTVLLEVTVWDWSATCSGVMEEYTIKCYSSEWTGSFDASMTPTDSGPHHYTYLMKAMPESLNSTDPVPVWIQIVYPGLDYSNPLGIQNEADGVLSSYFRVDVPVNEGTPTEFKWKIDTLSEGNGEGKSIDLVLRPGDNIPLVTATGQHVGPDPDPIAAHSYEWTGSSWIKAHHWAAWPENGTGAAYRTSDFWPCMFFARNPDSGDDLWFDYKDADGWHPVDHVEDGTPTGLSCAMDPSDNTAHMACRRPGLWYYSGDLTNWSGELIDSAPGDFTDCWISPAGVHYIAYDDTSTLDLKVAKGKPGSWTTTIVPDPISKLIGFSGAIAGYSSGSDTRIALVYKDKLNLLLRYAEWDGVDWSFSNVTNIGNPGDYCSIDFDATGNRYVAYYFAWTGDLWLATSPDGLNWTNSPVDESSDDVGKWCVIKVTDEGLPRIAYGGPDKLFFAWGEK
jgi:hypothetical protein